MGALCNILMTLLLKYWALNLQTTQTSSISLPCFCFDIPVLTKNVKKFVLRDIGIKKSVYDGIIFRWSDIDVARMIH